MTIQEVLAKHAEAIRRRGTWQTFLVMRWALEGYSGPDGWHSPEAIEWNKTLASATVPALEEYFRSLPPERNPVQVLAEFMERYPDLPKVLDHNLAFCRSMEEADERSARNEG